MEDFIAYHMYLWFFDFIKDRVWKSICTCIKGAHNISIEPQGLSTLCRPITCKERFSYLTV